MAALGKLPWIPWREHKCFVVQGWLLFCFNFSLFYNASIYTTSGLIAVVFSMSTIFNIVNSYLFYQRIPGKRAVFGTTLGITGVCTIFWDDIFTGPWSGGNITGLLLALGGTYCFSLGNLVSQHIQKQGRKVITINSYALVYGSITVGLWCLIHGYAFDIDFTSRYLGSLAFLVILGTIIAFTLYLGLVGRGRPEKVAYCTVLVPIVAFSLSTIFEGYEWTLLSLAGVVLALIGNMVVFTRSMPFKRRHLEQH